MAGSCSDVSPTSQNKKNGKMQALHFRRQAKDGKKAAAARPLAARRYLLLTLCWVAIATATASPFVLLWAMAEDQVQTTGRTGGAATARTDGGDTPMAPGDAAAGSSSKMGENDGFVIGGEGGAVQQVAWATALLSGDLPKNGGLQKSLKEEEKEGAARTPNGEAHERVDSDNDAAVERVLLQVDRGEGAPGFMVDEAAASSLSSSARGLRVGTNAAAPAVGSNGFGSGGVAGNDIGGSDSNASDAAGGEGGAAASGAGARGAAAQSDSAAPQDPQAMALWPKEPPVPMIVRTSFAGNDEVEGFKTRVTVEPWPAP